MSEIKIRRAPSGKLYAVWHGHPICDEGDGLCYFDTEEAVRGAVTRCDLVLTVSDTGETVLRLRPTIAGSVMVTAVSGRDLDARRATGNPCSPASSISAERCSIAPATL